MLEVREAGGTAAYELSASVRQWYEARGLGRLGGFVNEHHLEGVLREGLVARADASAEHHLCYTL